MLVGYMRVSSADDRQTVDLQRDALVAAGVDERHLHTDKASGARDDRPGLKTCLEYLNAGDTLIVWKLDRLGRSLSHLLAIVTGLKTRGIAFRSLTEQMDTTTPHGELLFSLFDALAQYERACCSEPSRTQGWPLADDRYRNPRTDYDRAGWWGQQGVCLPYLQGTALDANRHARPDRLDRTREDLSRSHQAICLKNTRLSRIGSAMSLISSDML